MEKVFFDVSVKSKEEIIEISKSNDYTICNLLDYEYFSKHYKLIPIDLSKKVELKQQINFIGKVEEDEAAIFFIIEKSEGTTFEFLQIL